jgi:hypothetical protein
VRKALIIVGLGVSMVGVGIGGWVVGHRDRRVENVVRTVPTIVVTPTTVFTTLTVPPATEGPQDLTVEFTTQNGCVDMSQARISLRSPNGNGLTSFGDVLELPTSQQQPPPPSCDYDFIFPLQPADRFFAVVDEDTSVYWGPYSYDQMVQRGFTLRLKAESKYVIGGE